MITLALGMVVWGLAFRWVVDDEGGTTGSLASRARRWRCPGASGRRCRSSTSRSPRWGLAWALLAVIVRSPFGLGLKGIRESETRMRRARLQRVAAQVPGVRPVRNLCGVRGSFWAYYNGFVSPVDVQLVTSWRPC